MVTQAEERLSSCECQLREVRREMEEKLVSKTREMDAQEAHYTAELVRPPPSRMNSNGSGE